MIALSPRPRCSPGLPEGELDKQRRRAMEATDLGLRLEAALEFTSDMAERWQARLV